MTYHHRGMAEVVMEVPRKSAPVRSSEKPPERMEQLDSLRAFAALMVFSLHAHLSHPSWGFFAVMTFYALSGYLMANQARPVTLRTFPRFALEFYFRRAMRILPTYYLVVSVYSWVLWQRQFLVQHLTFQLAHWLFWSVKTEVIFYAIFPVLWLVLQLASRPVVRTILGLAIALGIWAIVEHHYAAKITGGVGHIFVWITPFLGGTAIGHLRVRGDSIPKPARWGLFAAFVLVVCFLCLDWAPLPEWRERFLGLHRPNTLWNYTLVGELLGIAAVAVAAWLPVPLLQWRWLAAFGRISFSFYLWHTLVLFIMHQWVKWPDAPAALAGFLGTLVLAIATFYLVENPTHRWARRISRKFRGRAEPPACLPELDGEEARA